MKRLVKAIAILYKKVMIKMRHFEFFNQFTYQYYILIDEIKKIPFKNLHISKTYHLECKEQTKK